MHYIAVCSGEYKDMLERLVCIVRSAYFSFDVAMWDIKFSVLKHCCHIVLVVIAGG